MSKLLHGVVLIFDFFPPVHQVRNSSTLLFSTLITRIFGVKKGKDEHSKKNRSVDAPSEILLLQFLVYFHV